MKRNIFGHGYNIRKEKDYGIEWKIIKCKSKKRELFNFTSNFKMCPRILGKPTYSKIKIHIRIRKPMYIWWYFALKPPNNIND